MSFGEFRVLTCLVHGKELNAGPKLANVHHIGPIEMGSGIESNITRLTSRHRTWHRSCRW